MRGESRYARWTTPDPLADKYHSTSPYAFCNNNPVNFVDPDGRYVETIWDVVSISIGIKNLRQNIKAGNVKAAIGDGVGILIDGLAAAVPVVPGGIGVARTVGKGAINAAEGAIDAAKAADAAKDAGKAVKLQPSTALKDTPTKGENIHTRLGKQMHKSYNPGEGYQKEFRLPSGKRVDAVNIEKGDIRELKPNNKRSIKQGEKQVKDYMNELKKMHPDRKWEWHIDVYNK